MNERDFEQHLSQFGSDLEGWPTALRTEALQLLAQSNEANRLLDAEKKVDLYLQQDWSVPPSHNLESRILATFAERRSRFNLTEWMDFIWKPAFAAACSLVVGFYFGTTNQELFADLEEELTYASFFDYETTAEDLNDES